MDNLKEAFQKVKSDIDFLKQEIDFFKNNLVKTRESMIEICELIKKIDHDNKEITKKLIENSQEKNPAHQQIIKTDTTIIPTHQHTLEPLKGKNIPISTGNEGVPTNRQTNRQTDEKPQISYKIKENPVVSTIDNAVEILNSLDNLKREIRLKFKRLTEQEMLIFSTLYQLEEEQGFSDYKTLSQRLNLTESSIRDYIGRLIKKGIPVEKNKINNKNIRLNISANLKKIATLHTILQLRDL